MAMTNPMTAKHRVYPAANVGQHLTYIRPPDFQLTGISSIFEQEEARLDNRKKSPIPNLDQDRLLKRK